MSSSTVPLFSLVMIYFDWLLQDMYADANGAPVKDVSQDVKLLSAVEADGVTTVQFKRMIDTCDEEKDNIIMVWIGTIE